MTRLVERMGPLTLLGLSGPPALLGLVRLPARTRTDQRHRKTSPSGPLCTAWGKPCGPPAVTGGHGRPAVGQRVGGGGYDHAVPQVLHRKRSVVHRGRAFQMPADLLGRRLSTASTALTTTSFETRNEMTKDVRGSSAVPPVALRISSALPAPDVYVTPRTGAIGGTS